MGVSKNLFSFYFILSLIFYKKGVNKCANHPMNFFQGVLFL